MEKLELGKLPVTDRNLSQLQALPRLKSLDASGGESKVTDAGMVYVGQMKQLESIMLPSTISDAGAAKLASLTSLKSLYIGGPITDAGLGYVAGLRNLEELTLWCDQITDAGIERIATLTKLKALHIGNCQMTNAGLARLAELKSLEKLTIRKSNITLAGLNHLNSLVNLRELVVYGAAPDGTALNISGLVNLQTLHLGLDRSSEFRDEDFNCLSKLTQLGDLQMTPHKGITNSALGKLMIQDENAKRHIKSFHYWTEAGDSEWEYMGQAQGDVSVPAGVRLALTVGTGAWKDLSCLFALNPDDLHTLSIYGPPAGGPSPGGPLPGDGCMPCIAHLTGLKILYLGNTNVTERGLQSIRSLTTLERLTLSKRVTDRTLAEIAGLSTLRALYLDESRLTDEGLAQIQKLTNLEELSLGQGRMTNAALAHLAKLPRLRYLMLQGKGWTDAGMVHLANLANLTNMERLGIGGPELTDDGLRHLASVKRLNHLTIGDGHITDAGLGRLAGFKALSYLNITTRGRITAAGKRLLREKLPDLGFFETRPWTDSPRPPGPAGCPAATTSLSRPTSSSR